MTSLNNLLRRHHCRPHDTCIAHAHRERSPSLLHRENERHQKSHTLGHLCVYSWWFCRERSAGSSPSTWAPKVTISVGQAMLCRADAESKSVHMSRQCMIAMIYCLQLPCATFLMSSMSSSPIDIARDNTAPRCYLLLQNCHTCWSDQRPPASFASQPQPSTAFFPFGLHARVWQSSYAWQPSMYACVQWVHGLTWAACGLVHKRRQSRRSRWTNLTISHLFFFALVRLHAINVSVVVARAPAGTPETKEIMMVHVLSIILLSDIGMQICILCMLIRMHIMHAYNKYDYWLPAKTLVMDHNPENPKNNSWLSTDCPARLIAAANVVF